MSKSRMNGGFTIVELLIVIVVIGILAAITVVAYSGMQARARDSQRKSDIAAITKALELYYIDKGEYPPGSGSTTINGGWSTTADDSWANLEIALKPYMAKLPTDPVGTKGVDPRLSDNLYARAYSYYSNTSNYCGAAPRQMYILHYRFDVESNHDTFNGECVSNPIRYVGSNYRVVR